MLFWKRVPFTNPFNWYLDHPYCLERLKKRLLKDLQNETAVLQWWRSGIYNFLSCVNFKKAYKEFGKIGTKIFADLLKENTIVNELFLCGKLSQYYANL
jgi:hypothetical protein